MSSRRDRLRSLDQQYDFSVDKGVGIQLTERQQQLRQQRLESNSGAAASSVTSRTMHTSKEQSASSSRPFQTLSNKSSKPGHELNSTSTKRVHKEKGSTHHSIKLGREAFGSGPRSSASTTVYRSQQKQDQKALLRKVLASKRPAAAKSSARSTASTSANNPMAQQDRRAFLQRVVSERRADLVSSASESEAHSTISTSATSSHDIDQKALLRQVLAKSRAKKQHQVSDGRAEKKTHKREASYTSVGTGGSSVGTGGSIRKSSVGIAKKPAVISNEGSLKRLRDMKRNIEKERTVKQQLSADTDVAVPPQLNSSSQVGAMQGTKVAVHSIDARLKNMQEPVKETAMEEETVRMSSKRKPVSHITPERRKKEKQETSEPISGRAVHSSKIKDIAANYHYETENPTTSAMNYEASMSKNQSQKEASSPDWSVSFDNREGEDGFTKFKRALQQEVSSDHVELWRSFQSLFHDNAVRSTSPIQKSKRTKFDDETKECLATMNLYLKSTSTVECVTETQLVNDKKVAREKRQESASTRNDPPEARQIDESGERDSIVSRQCQSEIVGNRQSLTTRQFLEKARKRLARRQSSTRPSGSYMSLNSPEKVVPENVDLSGRKDSKIEPQDESIVSEWPQPDEDIQTMNSAEKRQSWLAMYRSKNRVSIGRRINDETDTNAFPSWPTLHSVDDETRSTTSEVEGSNTSAAPRPMPWLAALQERKARLATQTQSREDSSSEKESVATVQMTDFRKPISAEAGADMHIERQRSLLDDADESYDAEEIRVPPESQKAFGDENDMPIERQRSLLDDDTDDDEESCMSPKSMGSLSGGKRRQEEEPVAPEESVNPSVPSWSAIKLRSALNQRDTGEDSRESNDFLSPLKLRAVSKSRTAQSECGVPWSTVKLRPVASKEEGDEEQPAQTEDLASFRQMLRRVPSDAIRNHKVPSGVRLGDNGNGMEPGLMFAQHASHSQHGHEDAIKEDSRIQIGSEIDLQNLPNDQFEEQEQTFIMPLQRTPGMPNTDKLFVVIGKQSLMIVRSREGSPLSRVNWHETRENIQSLSLDMAVYRADLSILDNGAKSLTFSNTEDCLNFANAFYLTKTLDQNSPTQRPAPIADSEAHNFENSETPLKTLSDEEEKLLETYRLMRRTKAPDEAMKYSMAEKGEGFKTSETTGESPKQRREGTGTSSVGTEKAISSVLSEEEEKIASKFRKMLKFSIPCEAVRHKMKMEQVPDAVVNAVFGETQADKGTVSDKGTASDERSPDSGLSDEDKTIASKYRKMLQMRVPVDAVRHKMVKDQVNQRIISSVLSEDKLTAETVVSGLTDDEAKIVQTYKRMLKMMVPADAVRHRMRKEQVDQKIITSVLGHDPDDPMQSNKVSASGLSGEEEKTASKYQKMLKMSVPPDAVRHRMEKDNADPKIVVAVLGSGENESQRVEVNAPAVLSASDEIIATKYRKMLKMMVPIDAVRHKMKKEKIDPKVIAAVLGPLEKSPGTLSEEEDRVASTYRKMLKLNIPKEAVRHRMVRDGVDNRIIAAVLQDTAKTAPSMKPASKGSKLVALHWTPLSEEQLDNSIWQASKKRKVNADGSDVSKLVELFQKKKNPKVGKGAVKDSSSGSGSDEMAKLVDLNRANNVAISLKAFKEFAHKELADTITNLDPQKIIQGERCQFVKDLLPNATETKAIKAYKGPDKKLVTAELFFRELVKVQRIDIKVRVMQTMDTFKENGTELSSRFRMLSIVCKQVMESEKLQDVLEMVLQVGNIMNEGTRTGDAAGFKFDSLLKLTQTKSADGKTTVLDYIVMTFMAKNSRESLQLSTDFPDVQSAGRMALNDMTADVQAMAGALNQCKSELAQMKKDQSDKPVTRSMSKRFNSAVGPSTSDPRNAFLAAIKAKGQEGEQSSRFQKSDQSVAATRQEGNSTSVGELLNAITHCGQMDDVYDSDDGTPRKEVSSPRTKMMSSIKAESRRKVKEAVKASQNDTSDTSKSGSHEAGVHRLEYFIGDASAIIHRLESDRDDAIKACKDLSMYCGENGGERAAISLLSILSQFVTNLDNAVKKYDVKEEARVRKEAAMKKREQSGQYKKVDSKNDDTVDSKKEQEKSKNANGNVEKKGPSLVLMVNDMLHSASDQAKADFAKGVVYEKTCDTRLRTIYQRERNSLGGVLMPQTEGRESILSAIKKRRKNDDGIVLPSADANSNT